MIKKKITAWILVATILMMVTSGGCSSLTAKDEAASLTDDAGGEASGTGVSEGAYLYGSSTADATYSYGGSVSGDGTEASGMMSAKESAEMEAGTDFADTGLPVPEPDGAYIADKGEPDDEVITEPDEPIIIEPVDPAAGMLTAGEWNDNEHYDFLKKLLADGQNYDYAGLFTSWGLSPFNRLTIKVTFEDGTPMSNAYVQVYDTKGVSWSEDELLWASRTDNEGMTYAYYSIDGSSELPGTVVVYYQDGFCTYEVNSADLMDDSLITISFGSDAGEMQTLDLMLVVDTTGSMGDEIQYLQKELEDVITRVKHDNANIPVRLSVNFYRDVEDDYIVRSYPFSTDIEEELAYLRVENAYGGGDYEEAVEEALDDAINNHVWNTDAVKIMFLVLDAPPHNTMQVRQSLMSSVSAAADKGIRIIPIAASGVDKSTEFLLRALAMATGGTYTFLTNDSGIGNEHLEPTVGSYEVEYLNDLMVRIIDEYLK